MGNFEDFEELEKDLLFQFDYTANFIKSFKREFQQIIDKSLNTDEFSILMALHFRPDVTQSDLARFLFKGKAHVGKILNEMESRGLIKRVADTKDNIIIKRNEITSMGQKIIEKGEKQVEELEAAFDSAFTEEETEQFLSYLERFRNALSSLVDVKLK